MGFIVPSLEKLFSVRKQVKSKQSQGQQPMSFGTSQIQSSIGNKNNMFVTF